jgi:serine/threonine protein kinase
LFLTRFITATAPGKAHAPEEYLYRNLTEKIDMDAVANVLYEIINGTPAWYENGTTDTKNMVIKGIIPNVPEQYRINNTIDNGLFQLTQRCCQVNPDERISSTELVQEIESLATTINIKLK